MDCFNMVAHTVSRSRGPFTAARNRAARVNKRSGLAHATVRDQTGRLAADFVAARTFAKSSSPEDQMFVVNFQ
jgi:hypothetical protein